MTGSSRRSTRRSRKKDSYTLRRRSGLRPPVLRLPNPSRADGTRRPSLLAIRRPAKLHHASPRPKFPDNRRPKPLDSRRPMLRGSHRRRATRLSIAQKHLQAAR
jgi:hypothetical protein